MTWQIVHSLRWSGAGGAVARWTLPIAASAVVILIHHLGYWNCRDRILVPIALGCSLLTVGYLVTASVVAPALGANLHGTEMPPVERPTATEAGVDRAEHQAAA